MCEGASRSKATELGAPFKVSPPPLRRGGKQIEERGEEEEKGKAQKGKDSERKCSRASRAEIYSEGQTSSIFRQSSNPLCGSWKSQAS